MVWLLPTQAGDPGLRTVWDVVVVAAAIFQDLLFDCKYLNIKIRQ